MQRLAAAGLVAVALVVTSGTATARTSATPSFASAEIATVVDEGLMGPSVPDFRPTDPMTWTDLAVVVASLGGSIAVTDPDAPVTIRQLDAQLVTLAGLRPVARGIRGRAIDAGLRPRPWLGTETVARMLGFRINHPRQIDSLELEVTQPATREEAAYSVAKYLALDEAQLESVRTEAETFSIPALTEWERDVLDRALRFVGAPYVWAGTSEKPQKLFGKVLPGGFDCSGFVWRVYKLEPFAGASELGSVLKGRTSYDMSGEVPPALRLTRDELRPGDVVFFGNRGARSAPSEVGHMGIYVGNDWIVHSSRFGTTLTPMTGWYATTFAWGRSPLSEAGLEY
jgi:cell wall-associated NlpC family hydrolase